jgi:methionine salvage enolase-phosphatase E1
LTDWQRENGQASLERLLEAMEKSDGLTREQGMFLLADCLEPYELNAVAKLMKQGASDQVLRKAVENSINDWEQTKQLVKIVSRWLDKKKKVLQ